jgi:hypothetical protein
MQKRRIYFVDAGDEALLPCCPPDPQANAIGNGKWRKRNRQKREEQNQHAHEKQATF